MIMDLTNEFGQVFNDYENRLFEIFRTVIDTAINYTIEKNMNPVDRYAYVNNALENAYKHLAYVQGYGASPDLPYEAHPQLSDELTERIYSYIDPVTQEAQKELQKEVDDIIASSSLGELMEKLDQFRKGLEEKGIADYLYEDLEIKKRV